MRSAAGGVKRTIASSLSGMLGGVLEQPTLRERLRAAGVEPGTAPVEAWRRLRSVEGTRVTIIDLYEMVAEPRGLAPHQLPRDERIALVRAVMPEVWPGWETTADSDRPDDVIRIVDYDPAWPAQFERWRDRLWSALGHTALRIEHVGSTSVPGLAAKAIIDIQVSVSDIDDEARYVPQIEETGVQLRSRDAVHRYFRPYPDRPRDVHVHVCAAGSDWEREHLLFRDYLRMHPGARHRYAAAKRQAAELWADDGWAFTDAKSDAVLTILDEAKEPRRGMDGGRPKVGEAE
jgi:GrpB-like predicted nucleotidyltransferase (UPF0157 family)